MKKKMKKILTLGTVALALSPIAGVVACGNPLEPKPGPNPKPDPKPTPTVDPKLAVARAEANNIIDSLNASQDGWKTADKGFAWDALQDQIKESKNKIDAAKSVDEVKKLVENPKKGTEVALVITQRNAYNLVDKYKGTLSDDLMTKFNNIKSSETIAQDVFKDATQLTGIYLNSGVKVIEDNAFGGAPLTAMNLPDTLTSIGDNAFKSALLTDLTIKNKVTSVGASAFESAPLTSLTLSNTLSTIKASAFKSAQLTSLVIPNSVTSIENSAFQKSPLESITLSNSLTSIGNEAFSSAQLKHLVIPDSVTVIGENAFKASPLTSLAVSTKAVTIKSFAFKGIVNDTATNVTMPWAFQDNDAKKDIFGLNVEHPDTIKIHFIYPDKPEIPVDPKLAAAQVVATNALDKLDVNQDGWKTGDGGDAWNDFKGAITNARSEVANATTAVQVEALVKSAAEGSAIHLILGKKSIYDGLNKYKGTLSPEAIVQFKAITTSVSSATSPLLDSWDLTGLDLKTVTTIEGSAFMSAPLTTLILSESLTSIGDYAFHSVNLTDLTIPDSVTSIGNNCFDRLALTSLTLPKSLTSIGDHAFSSFKLTSLVIPDSVTSIGAEAFKASPLVNLIVSPNTTTIGNMAFGSIVDDATTNVTMPWVFQDDDNKKSIFGFTNPDSVQINFIYPDKPAPIAPPTLAESKANANAIIDDLNINDDGWKTTDNGQAWSDFLGAITKAGSDVANATTVAEVEALVKSKTEGTAVESILTKKTAYTSLNKYKGSLGKYVDLFNSIKNMNSIGDRAFSGLTGLTGIYLATPITSIGDHAFEGAQLTTVTIPNSVTSIGFQAFLGISDSGTVSIPLRFKDSLIKIFGFPSPPLHVTYT